MKNFMLAIVLFLSLSKYAMASVELNPADAIKEIKNEFLGYTQFNGISSDGSKCQVSILNLENTLGGIQIVINNGNKNMTVSLESSHQKVFKTTRIMQNQTITSYEIYDNEAQDSALISISQHEDMFAFDLTLMASVLKNKLLSCSFGE